MESNHSNMNNYAGLLAINQGWIETLRIVYRPGPAAKRTNLPWFFPYGQKDLSLRANLSLIYLSYQLFKPIRFFQQHINQYYGCNWNRYDSIDYGK